MPPARLARRASSARRAIVDADAGEGEAIVLDDVSEARSAAAEEAEDDPAVPSSMKVPKSAVVRDLAKEVESRRTFAIIPHPDAGKTTLTEKLLYYGGAINEAGAVRSRRGAKAATSDWMEMEQQRGISISSTALSFAYSGSTLNLLDTPATPTSPRTRTGP